MQNIYNLIFLQIFQWGPVKKNNHRKKYKWTKEA